MCCVNYSENARVLTMNSLSRVLFWCFVFSCSSYAATDWNVLDNSVIRLVVSQGDEMTTGTAFAVNDDGYYATNHHVIEAALSGAKIIAMESTVPEVKSHAVTIIWHSQAKDLALIRVSSWNNTGLGLYPSEGVRKNQAVVTIGFPGASDISMQNAGFTEPKIKQGVISARQEFPLIANASPTKMFEHDATVNSGNSGGPLVDLCGRVVGVNQSKALSYLNANDLQRGAINIQEGTFFSVRIDELIVALKQNNISYIADSSVCDVITGSVEPWIKWLLFIVLGTVLLLFVFIHKLAASAPDAKIDSRYLSRLIREKIGKQPGNSIVEDKEVKFRRGSNGEIIENGREKNLGEPHPRPLHEVQLKLHAESGYWPVIKLRQDGEAVRVGRDPNQVDVVLEDEYISSLHLEITLIDGEVWVSDPGSSNGSFINATKLDVAKQYKLRSGDRLIFGSENLVYRLQD